MLSRQSEANQERPARRLSSKTVENSRAKDLERAVLFQYLAMNLFSMVTVLSLHRICFPGLIPCRY